VDDEHSIIDFPLGIAMRAAKSGVMNAQVGQALTFMKAVIFKPCIRLGSDCMMFLCNEVSCLCSLAYRLRYGATARA
jgi:hypothetical protein